MAHAIFYGLASMLEFSKKLGININLEPINPLAKKVIEDYKKIAAKRGVKQERVEKWLKDAKDSAKAAGLQVE